MGVIGRPHGVRGLVHVHSYTAAAAELPAYGPFSDVESPGASGRRRRSDSAGDKEEVPREALRSVRALERCEAARARVLALCFRVTFTIVSGPNHDITTGTCSVNANCATDANGQVNFTYTRRL